MCVFTILHRLCKDDFFSSCSAPTSSTKAYLDLTLSAKRTSHEDTSSWCYRPRRSLLSGQNPHFETPVAIMSHGLHQAYTIARSHLSSSNHHALQTSDVLLGGWGGSEDAEADTTYKDTSNCCIGWFSEAASGTVRRSATSIARSQV